MRRPSFHHVWGTRPNCLFSLLLPDRVVILEYIFC